MELERTDIFLIKAAKNHFSDSTVRNVKQLIRRLVYAYDRIPFESYQCVLTDLIIRVNKWDAKRTAMFFVQSQSEASKRPLFHYEDITLSDFQENLISYYVAELANFRVSDGDTQLLDLRITDEEQRAINEALAK